ncbi:MAG: TlpA family protein disulfide reductase [Acidobacteria bacterium]|nr:TlpA family protein disulfide reductase [Acidobacteriota bacterium]MBI3657455.1 TlpA family protein disulfide reductase [Acidobacteriota bacterium]
MARVLIIIYILAMLGVAVQLFLPSLRADQSHEYAEIKPVKVRIENFTLKTVMGDRTVSLKEFVKGHRLVLISFMAPWCDNSIYDAPTINKLYEKYSDKGLEILTVSNYAPAEELMSFVEQFNFVHTVVLDTRVKDENCRLNSRHYQFRKNLGDNRKWGTPLNVFVIDGQLDSPHVALGELIEANAIAFIESFLSRPSKAKRE